MARETKEQRQEREIREQTERAIAQAEFRKMLPARMKALEQLAQRTGVYVGVSLLENGPEIRFNSDDGHVDTTLSYDSEEWEVTFFEDQLQTRMKLQEEAKARKQMAQDHFSSLSTELKAALKENLYYLK